VPLLLATWPAMGERERGALNEGVGEIMWSWNFGRDLNFWKNGKSLWLWRKGNKGKGKMERNS